MCLQHFYQNKLQDAPSIVAAPDEPFYALQLLKPYVFFDVARGQMARGRSGASMGNQVTGATIGVRSTHIRLCSLY